MIKAGTPVSARLLLGQLPNFTKPLGNKLPLFPLNPERRGGTLEEW